MTKTKTRYRFLRRVTITADRGEEYMWQIGESTDLVFVSVDWFWNRTNPWDKS